MTGEPFTYTNFAIGEPDDDAGITGNGEVLVMLSDGTWDDTDPALDAFAQGFVVEWTNDTPDLDGDGLYGNEDPDDDNDGVSDGDDACPTTPAATANGCPAAESPTPTPSETPIPVTPTSPDVTPPTLKLSGKRTLPARRTVSLTVRSAAEARRVRATAKLRLGSKSIKLQPPAARDVAAGGSPILRFAMPARTLAKVKAALRLRKRVSVRITVTAADTAGNVATAVWEVRLR